MKKLGNGGLGHMVCVEEFLWERPYSTKGIPVNSERGVQKADSVATD